MLVLTLSRNLTYGMQPVALGSNFSIKAQVASLPIVFSIPERRRNWRKLLSDIWWDIASKRTTRGEGEVRETTEKASSPSSGRVVDRGRCPERTVRQLRQGITEQRCYNDRTWCTLEYLYATCLHSVSLAITKEQALK